MVDDITVDPGGIAGAENTEEVEAVSLPHPRAFQDQRPTRVLLSRYEIKHSHSSLLE